MAVSERDEPELSSDVGPTKSPYDKDEKILELPSYAAPGLLIETIQQRRTFHSDLKYLVWNGNGPKPKLEKSYRVDGQGIEPPGDFGGCVHSGAVFLPTGLGPEVSTDELLDDLEEFISSYWDASRFWQRLAAHYALASWVFDKFPTFGYVRMRGGFSTGKSRFLQTMAQVCYRAIVAGGADSIATIYRDLDLWRGTLVIDEADFRDSSAKSEIVQILNVGYMHGMSVGRQDKLGGRYFTRRFNVYGPKILATRELLDDDGFESRCFTYTTPSRAVKKLKAGISVVLDKEEFALKGLELRNKLLTWRARNWSSVCIPSQLSELVGIDPRRVQIVAPLLAVSSDPDQFAAQVHEVLAKWQKVEKGHGGEAQVIRALEELESCQVSVKQVAELVNSNADEEGEEKLTDRKVGQILRDLGFEAKQSWKGTRAETRGRKMIYVDPKILERLSS